MTVVCSWFLTATLPWRHRSLVKASLCDQSTTRQHVRDLRIRADGWQVTGRVRRDAAVSGQRLSSARVSPRPVSSGHYLRTRCDASYD